MSFSSPANRIKRQSMTHMEGMFTKMWDPPKRNPATPDWQNPTNPVPEVMAMFGYQSQPGTPHTIERDLMHGVKVPAWDFATSGKELVFFLFRDKDNPATGGGNFPGATIRIPRGVIFHCATNGHGPPPHTIHWHGIEPTPMNDGVGHCSMEIGNYTYQFQPNFIGFYFDHCHRNTVQHFEFGLYNALLIEAPDAYFATLWDPAIPVGAGRDGKRRAQANLNRIGTEAPPFNGDASSGHGYSNIIVRTDDEVRLLFPGYAGGRIDDPDPEAGNASLPDYLKFQTNPHALTVPFDVEALWVYDDRDSRWSDLAPDARATFPSHGDIPGYNDNFRSNAGGGTVDSTKFFSFNDFNADYWFVTGVPVPGHKFETAELPPALEIPPALMSGVSGVQVSIEAEVGQTILVRALDAAYDCTETRFPVPVTVIAWDGRALGVPPYGFNNPYTVPAGHHIHQSVARRFDALIKVDQPVNDFAYVDFVDNEAQVAGDANARRVIFTAKIPINIGYSISGNIKNVTTSIGGVPLEGVLVTLTGTTDGGQAVTKTTLTDNLGNYRFSGLKNGTYTVTPTLVGFQSTPAARDVPVSGASVTGTDFTAIQSLGTFVVSGTVVSSRGAAVGIPQVVVTLSGATDRVVMTDDQGHFYFTNLAAGDYTVAPGQIHIGNAGLPDENPDQPANTAYAYSPPDRQVSITDSNVELGFFRGRRITAMNMGA